MAADDEFVTVQKRLFDCLRQHCKHCPDFDEQVQDLSDGRVVFVHQKRPSGEPSKKRKSPHEVGAQEPSCSSHQPEQQLPLQSLQQAGSELASQSSKTSQYKISEGARPKVHQKRLRQKPRKSEAVDWFIRNAPKANKWRQIQTKLELNTVKQYEEIIRALTGSTNVIVNIEGDEHLEDELIDLAKRFALLTRDFRRNIKLQRSFDNFQALILLSYCEVLRKEIFLT